MLSKVNVLVIVRQHYSTLYDNRTGSRWQDAVVFLGFPVAAALAIVGAGGHLRDTGDLLTGVSIIAGLLFSLMILLLGMAADSASRAEAEGFTSRLGRRIRFLRQISANVAYAVVVSIFSTVILGIGQLTLPITNTGDLGLKQPAWYSLIAIAITTHLMLTLLMVLKRIFTLLNRELDYAATPAERVK